MSPFTPIEKQECSIPEWVHLALIGGPEQRPLVQLRPRTTVHVLCIVGGGRLLGESIAPFRLRELVALKNYGYDSRLAC